MPQSSGELRIAIERANRGRPIRASWPVPIIPSVRRRGEDLSRQLPGGRPSGSWHALVGQRRFLRRKLEDKKVRVQAGVTVKRGQFEGNFTNVRNGINQIA